MTPEASTATYINELPHNKLPSENNLADQMNLLTTRIYDKSVFLRMQRCPFGLLD